MPRLSTFASRPEPEFPVLSRLLWQALALGALVSLWVALFGRSRPWLFQWRQREYHWYPTTDQRLHMLWLLQYLWAVAGLGMLLGFWVMLLSTDLAFGWSSTLIDDEQRLVRAAVDFHLVHRIPVGH